MFYKKGIDITNDKQMFNFLKNHFNYFTMNTWNRLTSIANNVKLYNLNLSGDWCTTLNLLNDGGYTTISCMIEDWEREHNNNFEVFFNGRSGGYLVLKDKKSNSHVLPVEIAEFDDYDEYKRFCKEFFGSVRANRSDLVFYTKLVQDFDKLCDDIRDYCDELSNAFFEVVAMEKSVEDFNNRYEADLERLGIEPLSCNGFGYVDISEIKEFNCLMDAFARLASREDCGYLLTIVDENTARLGVGN